MKCEICGKEYTNSKLGSHIKVHNMSNEEYFNKYLHVNESKCEYCGKPTQFLNIILGYRRFCSCSCSMKSKTTQEKIQQKCEEKYGNKTYNNREKASKTKLEKYGDEHFNNKEQARKTSKERYGVEYPIQSKEIEQRRDRTNICLFGTDKFKNNLKEKYGTETYRNKEKAQKTYIENTGYDNPFKNPIIIKKIQNTSKKKLTYDKLQFDSKSELYYYIWLKEHNIEFEYHNHSLEFEYKNEVKQYFPDFKVGNEYQEIKGIYFFENKDINCKMINPYDRTMDELYEAKHQCMIQNGVKIITDISEYENYVNEKYTKDFVNLFKNNLEFPYLNMELKDTSDYGIIQHFHKSIYEARKNKELSPIEAWENKEIIKKVALNRLKYVGKCKPNDIIQGFNVMKIAPKVSVFKPKKAEEIIKKYLNEYKIIFDPFSGFSGRMIGTMNCGKKYIGQDINEKHVKESNEIIEYKNYQNCTVIQQDILTDTNKEYECLFTCSPYGLKEIWNEEEVNKTCDEWIEICLEKYKCKKYVFVVDNTEKYKDKIVEEIENKSHFGTNKEYIIII